LLFFGKEGELLGRVKGIAKGLAQNVVEDIIIVTVRFPQVAIAQFRDFSIYDDTGISIRYDRVGVGVAGVFAGETDQEADALDEVGDGQEGNGFGVRVVGFQLVE